MDTIRAKNIIEGFDANGSANLQLFASDTQGVRPITDLLSEEQIAYLEWVIIRFMQQLIEEADEE